MFTVIFAGRPLLFIFIEVAICWDECMVSYSDNWQHRSMNSTNITESCIWSKFLAVMSMCQLLMVPIDEIPSKILKNYVIHLSRETIWRFSFFFSVNSVIWLSWCKFGNFSILKIAFLNNFHLWIFLNYRKSDFNWVLWLHCQPM